MLNNQTDSLKFTSQKLSALLMLVCFNVSK